MAIEPADSWLRFARQACARVQAGVALECGATLTRLTGPTLEAVGLRVPVGTQCTVQIAGQVTGQWQQAAAVNGQSTEPPHAAALLAEVAGFCSERAFLMPAGDTRGLVSGARVLAFAPCVPMPRLGQIDALAQPVALNSALLLPMGAGLLGRVLDARGLPLDQRGPLHGVACAGLAQAALNAMERAPVRAQLDTGVRAINALLCVGRGQRLGLFAGSGVGKSILLGMMARHTAADVIVVALIGERGREVREFVEDILGPAGSARAVVVASPADAAPLLRLQGAAYATALAEHFRDRGQHVLLLLDSLTRYAMAQREIALAIGEPPATRGYPPSCFAKLAQLVERSGNGPNGQGSITAFYTVLTEADDAQDPVADAARAILDGHIVLARALAQAGHFPAIDLEQSNSRLMHRLIGPAHQALAQRFRALHARYQKNRELLQVGAYVTGSDPELDQAIALQPQMQRFLQQHMDQPANLEQSLAALAALLAP